jgi:spoIIIJ-associated protein
MKKVEASTLEEAYQKAAALLKCSITNIQYEVIQYPSKGIFGLFKKSAIIVASCNKPKESKSVLEEIPPKTKEIVPASPLKEETPVVEERVVEGDAVLESFFDTDTKESNEDVETIVCNELAQLIEDQLKELLSYSCFDIDIVEVDVVDNTALVFIDGKDAALLIGKEGYRYNALSYMLFNWLHTKYELFIKLEIAEFLTSQQEMIRNYIKPVIENVERYGKGKTRPLDGILVQIALEQLREIFPNKYVAVKTARDGSKFVVINEFHNKSHV